MSPRPKETRFVSDGIECVADLYEPTSTPRGLVIMGPGFASSQNVGLPIYARAYTLRGYRVLTFDYTSFGRSSGDPRQVLTVRRQLSDWFAALEHARHLQGGTLERVSIWGVSLSAGYVIHVAARTPELAACLAVVPNADLRATALRNVVVLGPRVVGRLAVMGMTDVVAARIAGRRSYAPIAVDAGVGFIVGTDVPAHMHQITSGMWDNRVAAGIALTLARFRPVRDVRLIRCPLHITYATHDEYAPIKPLLRRAALMPNATTLSLEGGHWAAWANVDAIVDSQIIALEPRGT